MAAAKIMYDVHKKAIRLQGSKSVRAARSWWAREVQFNVSQHMGWLGKGLSDTFLYKTARGSLHLGEGTGISSVTSHGRLL